MPKKKSIIRQVEETLEQKLRIGESKHLAKQQGVASEGIYSFSTLRTYLAKSCAFARWARDNHGCRTLTEARNYVDAYLQHYTDEGYKASTQKTIASSLAKLYGCTSSDFIPTQSRYREDITRSRLGKAKFSESRNKEFVDFCKATGLRRSEITRLRPEQLSFDEATGKFILADVKGKGGRLRDFPVLSKEAVERVKNTPFGQKVWDIVPSRADIHSYRADFCESIYKLHARPLSDIPKAERYYCRKDRKGIIYDKRAMRIASKALGHNRISIIAGHYLYNLQGGTAA